MERNARTHARTDKNQKRQKHPKPSQNPIKRVFRSSIYNAGSFPITMCPALVVYLFVYERSQ